MKVISQTSKRKIFKEDEIQFYKDITNSKRRSYSSNTKKM